MTSGSSTSTPLVGLIRVREHCTFTWQRLDGSDERTVTVHDHHCPQCLTEVRRRGFKEVTPDGKDYSG